MCHVHVFLNDASGTLSATLFTATAEKLIGYFAVELIEASDKLFTVCDASEKKIDKKEVVCFLKDYDRYFESRFEKTFPVVKLYTRVEIDFGKETQMFSPSMKGAADEIATEVGVDGTIVFPSSAVKINIVFDDISDKPEDGFPSNTVASTAHESSIHASGSESPLKKLKNTAAEN